MKREYQKPAFYMENFALSQSIALVCFTNPDDNTLGKPTHLTKEECAWDDGTARKPWTSSVAACTDQYDNGANPDMMCYNNTIGGTSVFAYS